MASYTWTTKTLKTFSSSETWNTNIGDTGTYVTYFKPIIANSDGTITVTRSSDPDGWIYLYDGSLADSSTHSPPSAGSQSSGISVALPESGRLTGASGSTGYTYTVTADKKYYVCYTNAEQSTTGDYLTVQYTASSTTTYYYRCYDQTNSAWITSGASSSSSSITRPTQTGYTYKGYSTGTSYTNAKSKGVQSTSTTASASSSNPYVCFFYESSGSSWSEYGSYTALSGNTGSSVGCGTNTYKYKVFRIEIPANTTGTFTFTCYSQSGSSYYDIVINTTDSFSSSQPSMYFNSNGIITNSGGRYVDSQSGSSTAESISFEVSSSSTSKRYYWVAVTGYGGIALRDLHYTLAVPTWTARPHKVTGVNSVKYSLDGGSTYTTINNWNTETPPYVNISVNTSSSIYLQSTASSNYERLYWQWRTDSSETLHKDTNSTLEITQYTQDALVYINQICVGLPSTPTIVSNTGTSLIVNIPDVENAASYAASGAGGYYKVYSKLSTSSTWTQLTPVRQESGRKTFVTTPGNTYHIRYCYEYSDGTTTFTGSYSDTLIVTAPSVNWSAKLYYTTGVGSMSYKIGSGSWISINTTTTISVPINTYLYVSVDSVASGYEKLCWKWRVGTETATLNTQAMSSTWSITQSSSTNVYLNPYLVGTPSTPTLVSNVRGSITIDISAVLNAATYAASGEGGYYKVFSRLQGSSTWISYSSGRQEAGNKPFTTTPGNTYEFKYYYEYSDGSNTYAGSDSSILPVTAAGQFYWISSSQSVTTGYPVSSISYTKWNEFVEAIRTVLTSAQLSSSWSNTGTVRVSESLGFGYIGTKTTTSWLDYSKIDSSDKVLYYYKFNIVNHMLAQYISSHTYNQISTGQTVYASYFNNLQNYYNNNA